MATWRFDCEIDPRIEAAETLPAACYRSAEVDESERERIFAASWQLAGRQTSLPHPGSFLTTTIAGEPLLLVRGMDGKVRGFHNVCRHRAGPLAASGFDPRDFGLVPLQVETWRGFVFVNADASASPLGQMMVPLDHRLGDRDFSGLVHAERRTHDIACNWKIYVENYLEGYHIPNVHPGLAAQMDTARYQVTIDGAICFHSAPPRDAGASVYDGVWAFALPHLGFNSYGDDGLMLERIVPLGPAATRLVYDYYMPQALAANAQARQRILATSAIVTAEDKWICEKVQANIDAGVYDTGILSPKHEAGVAWFQAYFQSAIGGN